MKLLITAVIDKARYGFKTLVFGDNIFTGCGLGEATEIVLEDVVGKLVPEELVGFLSKVGNLIRAGGTLVISDVDFIVFSAAVIEEAFDFDKAIRQLFNGRRYGYHAGQIESVLKGLGFTVVGSHIKDGRFVIRGEKR